MKKILLTGCSGYVGGIVRQLLERKYEFWQTSFRSKSVYKNHYICNLCNPSDVQNLANNIKPDVIIYAAGVKNLKFCEDHILQTENINAQGFLNVIKSFGNNVKYIYMSSDYVFKGDTGNYRETDKKNPLTIYGKSKADAERLGLANAEKIFILRLSALFDQNATFPVFLRENFRNQQSVDCFYDVFYSPTYYENFLMALDVLIQREDYSNKVFHCGGERVSRYEFAAVYAKVLGYPVRLVKKAKVDGKNNFLFPDLSLDSSWSMEKLQIQPLNMKDALMRLK